MDKKNEKERKIEKKQMRGKMREKNEKETITTTRKIGTEKI